jgi:hypothetical protein
MTSSMPMPATRRRSTVSGCTTIKAVCHSRHPAERRIQKSKPLERSSGRLTVRVNGQLLTKREILERDRRVSVADQSDRSEEYE